MLLGHMGTAPHLIIAGPQSGQGKTEEIGPFAHHALATVLIEQHPVGGGGHPAARFSGQGHQGEKNQDG